MLIETIENGKYNAMPAIRQVIDAKLSWIRITNFSAANNIELRLDDSYFITLTNGQSFELPKSETPYSVKVKLSIVTAAPPAL